MKPSAEDMQLINKYSIHPLSPDEVYVFKMKLGDNELDRDFERFSTSALEDLCRLYLGRVGFISDHLTARIFKTKLEHKDSVTKLGDPYVELIAYAYIINRPEYAPIIHQIDDASINPEISIGCSAKHCRCSICGKDTILCYHQLGDVYDDKLCVGELSGIIDVYEWAFVKESIPTLESVEKLKAELEAAKNDIAALLWLNGGCEYCRFGQKDEYCGASRWTCKLGGAADCRPEWRGAEKTD